MSLSASLGKQAHAETVQMVLSSPPIVYAWQDSFGNAPSSNNPALYNGYSTPEEACVARGPAFGVNGINTFIKAVKVTDTYYTCEVSMSCCGSRGAGAYLSYGPRCPDSRHWIFYYGYQNCPATKTCPSVASGEPPYIQDSNGQTCSRPDQETYTLTLTPNKPSIDPSGTTAGDDNSSATLTISVIDQSTQQGPTKPVQVKLVAHKPTDGGHDHDDPSRPRGGLNGTECTTDEPCVTLTFNDGIATQTVNYKAPIVSGKHSFSATCDKCGNSPQTANLEVKVDGLIQIPDAIIRYAQFDSDGAIGAKPSTHEHNHYLTPASIIKLNKLADVYAEVNPGFRLFLNDASLEWGGLFDLGTTRWKKPHKTHRRGKSLDIRAASAAGRKGEVPANKFIKFINEAAKENLTVGLHCLDSSDTNDCLGQPNNRHFHVDF